jgi:hypothetical protein
MSIGYEDKSVATTKYHMHKTVHGHRKDTQWILNVQNIFVNDVK